MKQKLYHAWQRIESTLFPVLPDDRRELKPWQCLLAVAALTGFFAVIGLFVKPDGVIGFDWYQYFSKGTRLTYYPPWTPYVRFLTWPVLIGLSYAALTLGLFQRRAPPIAVAAAFLSLPSLWVLFLGQLEGIVLLGLIGLPYLAPLATLKPQISAFAFLARKEWAAALVLWLLLTMLIWGAWPLDVLQYEKHYEEHWRATYPIGDQPQNITLWPWSLPIGMLLLWLSRGDQDMLMLAGSFITPHYIPYNGFVILPALARVRQLLSVTLMMMSYLPLLSNWVGPWAWYSGHLFSLTLWIALYRQRRTWKNQATS